MTTKKNNNNTNDINIITIQKQKNHKDTKLRWMPLAMELSLSPYPHHLAKKIKNKKKERKKNKRTALSKTLDSSSVTKTFPVSKLSNPTDLENSREINLINASNFHIDKQRSLFGAQQGIHSDHS